MIISKLFQVLKLICDQTKMMSENQRHTRKDEYGTLKNDYPFYVDREADTELFDYIKSGCLCFVFNARKMGKSSLDERVRHKLEQKANFQCVKLDLTALGINTTLEQWYYSLISNLAKGLKLYLGDDAQLNNWWEKRHNKAPKDKFKDFLEELLQKNKDKNILIVFDEIDVFLTAPVESESKFSQKDKNEFFSFIRWCYNNKTDSDYQRLVFCLIGVISVSDLISESTLTPFNVGHPIELNGFQLEQAGVLIEKLGRGNIQNHDQVLRDILFWTDGQPFLTQKLCDLVIAQQNKNLNIDELVERKIINIWNSAFYPKYFPRIEDEVVKKNEENLGRRLTLYQKILEATENQGIEIADCPEQEQLCLSGLVIKRQGRLQVANKIFLRIFDSNWVHQKLNKIRVYPKERAINWESTGDTSLLLTGKELQDAIEWKSRMGFKLEESDHKFIEESIRNKEVAKQVAEITKGMELEQIIFKMGQRLVGKTTNQEKITSSIIEWTNDNLNLIKIIGESIDSESRIPEGTEGEWVQQWIQKNIIDNWQNSPLATKIADIKSCLLDSERSFWRLQTYQKILEGEGADTVDKNDVNALLVSRLVVKDNNKLQVANRIYEGIFSQEWVKEYLPPYAQSFTSWQASDCQDESLLLKSEDLQKAVNWIQNKNELSESELEFIITSLVWEIWQSDDAVNKIKEFLPQLQEKTHITAHLVRIIQAILEGTRTQLVLLQDVLQWVGEAEAIPTEDEAKWLEGVVRSLTERYIFKEFLASSIVAYEKAILDDIGSSAKSCIDKVFYKLVEILLNSYENQDRKFDTIEDCIKHLSDTLIELQIWNEAEKPINHPDTENLLRVQVLNCSYKEECQWALSQREFTENGNYRCQRLGCCVGAVKKYMSEELLAKSDRDRLTYLMTTVMDLNAGCQGLIFVNKDSKRERLVRDCPIQLPD